MAPRKPRRAAAVSGAGEVVAEAEGAYRTCRKSQGRGKTPADTPCNTQVEEGAVQGWNRVPRRGSRKLRQERGNLTDFPLEEVPGHHFKML